MDRQGVRTEVHDYQVRIFHRGSRDIPTTSAHYVGKKIRFDVKLDAVE